MSEWKPGDVAMVGTRRLFYTGNGRFVDPDGSVHGEYGGTRPLVVIDAEDAEQLERLRDIVYDLAGTDPSDRPASWCFADALREFARPTPRIEEPTGLGAVVEDSSGERWVRSHPEPRPWTRPHLTGTFAFSEVGAVRVLTPGVEVDS